MSASVDGYSVELTDEAFYALASIPSDRLFQHVSHDLELLGTTPAMGKVYDPVYQSARPTFPCRVVYCGYTGIYYRLDEAERRVVVFALVDQRRDPELRFR